MGPKKKGNKKGGDDWESELGENIDAGEAENGADPTAESAEPEMGGGLLAAARKNKSKRAKKGKDVNDFVEGEEADAGGVAGLGDQLAEKAPEEATADDLFAPTTTKGKPGKAKGASALDASKSDDEGSMADGGSGVKTKKEKEKEKKEREKQKKKELAAKKKASAPAKSEPASSGSNAAAATDELAAASSTAKADSGKKKKVPAALAALQKQMEERRQREAEDAKATAEQKAQAEEEARLEAEKSQKDAEARAKRKEREREKKEEMRKAGTLLTKAQKDAKAAAERRKEQMLAAGAKVAGLEDGHEEKKKPSYDKKKKGPKNKVDEEAVLLEAQRKAEEANAKLVAERERARKEAEQKAREEEAAAAPAAEEGSEPGDWDAASDSDDVKDAWDADSDEEREKKEQAKAAKQQQNGDHKDLPTRSKENGTAGINGKKTPAAGGDNSDDQDDDRSANQRVLEKRKAEAAARRQQQRDEAMAARSKENLRSPICCILGHVDTGKTKLLDKIRQTNVQEGEAGGITQQIGATYFPVDALQQKTAVVNKDGKFEFKVPGLLVIDTPGHESFTNLRSRGSSLCNIAILVVDIMHGLEPQTLESMRLLRDRKTPFIVALNKIDRLYGWKKIENNGFEDSLALQSKGVQNEFRDRLEKTKIAFAEEGFNSELFYENKSMARNVSLVPTSAHTGEGVPDMLKLLVMLTQERMTNKLMYLSELECTVLEVKVIEGLGTTIDVVLSNGVLNEGDRIVLCGLNGAIATTIRALLTPAPMKELRIKSQYVHNETVKAALGVKIAANDLEHAIAGSRLLVVGPDDDEEDLEEEVMADIESLLSRVSKTGRGVSVQASTLGSLEALLEFLKVSKIPVANISIGPVYKRDVMQAGIMLEKSREYAVMLCFDVKVDKDAQAYADEIGVKVFTADIIYHLFDDFTKHMSQLAEQRKEDSKLLAVFPCVLHPVAVFNKKDPIVVGVDVVEGSLKLLTPIAAVKTNPVTNVKEIVALGRVSSIERDHKQMQICKKGQPSVAVKIEGPNQPGYGRQLEDKDTLYSLISRASIDTLKEFYRADVSNEEWLLIKKLKGLFDVA